MSDCVLVGTKTQRLWLLSAFDYAYELCILHLSGYVSMCVSECVRGTEPETAVFSDSDWYLFALLRLSPLRKHTYKIPQTHLHIYAHI